MEVRGRLNGLLSLHVAGVGGLVLVFVAATLRPVNLGALALAMTFVVGSLFAGESVKAMYGGFPVDLLVLLAGVTPRKRPTPRVKEVHAGDVVGGKGWKVTVGHASHVQPQLECLAFRLDAEEGSLCYSGDSGGVCEELIELAKGCDLLIHMNHYLSGTEPTPSYRRACGNHRDNAVIARRAGVKALVLTHFLAQIDQPGPRDRIVQEVRQEFGGQVIWGEDLMQLALTRAGLSVRDERR